MTITEIDEKFMREALAEARAAATVGEVPIGAVVVRAGEIVARAHNRRELDQDPSAHAEFLALCAAAQTLGRWRLSDCTVYVTLEPCCMCAGLMVNARVGRCVYGAADAKAGAVGSLYDLNADSRLNHRFNVTAGVLADECRRVLSSYFSGLRDTDGAVCGCGADLEAHVAHAKALAGVGNLADETLNFGPVQRRPRRVLLVIDSFKGSVSSAQAEAAVAEGVFQVWPDAELSALPLADGGEGTLDAVAARGGELLTCEVAGPLGDRVSARMLVDGEHESAVVEMAEAAGIGYSPCTESAALAASTYGVGELMLRAVRAGAKTIYIGLGGSATNDGGAGMLQALGARVVDDQGCDVAPGLAGLEQVASVDLASALEVLGGVRVVVLSDVENPLVGRRGALAVFGGQKGLPTGDAEALGKYDGWMVGYGRLLDAAIARARAQGLLRAPEGARSFGSVLGVPGAGAAGGLGAALLALGAELRSGVETVLDLIGFDECVRDADLVITGEGNMDEQSAAGKAPVGVARRAKRYSKPVVAVVGGRADNLDAVYGQGIDLVLPVCRRPMPLDQALDPQESTTNLICAGEAAARAYDLGRI
ncbi:MULTISPECIES: tRNA adenosine(34) deaminase TadA [unclassified Collinsella]|uniref:tRNA adenosine(34) deaminase TadA n=1 Tax=unclassified Collinsella TaxID=2637548 RepID=UPI003F91F19F